MALVIRHQLKYRWLMLCIALAVVISNLNVDANRLPSSSLSPDLVATRERSCEASSELFLPLDATSLECKTVWGEAPFVSARSVGTTVMSSAIRHTLAVQLAARPDLGMVTCEPPRGRLRLRPLLVLDLKEVDTSNGYRNIKKLVQGDCGNKRFAYVATRTNEPSLLREAALASLGLNGTAALEEHAATVDLGGLLWRHGWSVAMVHCGLEELASGNVNTHLTTPADGPWAVPPSNAHKPLYGVVEVFNTKLTEARMMAAYPLRMAPTTPPPFSKLFGSSDKFYREGITVIVMTFQSHERASAAKRLLSQLTSMSATVNPIGHPLIAEGVLIWNGHGSKPEKNAWTPPSDFFADAPRCRLVLAPVNDLQNRMNMTLVKPGSNAVMILDDDSVLPSLETLSKAYALWKRYGGARLVGLLESRGPPILIPAATVGSVKVCGDGNYAYLGHPYCPNGNAWVVQAPYLFHQRYAQEYSSSPALAPLRAFVKKQPCFPDDLAFNTFVNWASGAPAVCTDQIIAQRQLLASESRELAVERVDDPFTLTWKQDANFTHRRLGLSGGPEWQFLRSHGSMWILHFFGGFYSHTGCWASARGSQGYTLAPDNIRYRGSCPLPDFTSMFELGNRSITSN